MRTRSKSKAKQRRRFAQKMIAALREYGETRPIRYNAGGNELLIGNQDELTYRMDLESAFHEYGISDPVQRCSLLRRHAQAIRIPRPVLKMNIPFDRARTQLLPEVKARLHYAPDTVVIDRVVHSKSYWHRPLGEHLAVGLAYDLPHAIVGLWEESLKNWGISGEDAFAIACGNLRLRSKKAFASPAPGVFVSAWDDNYGSSRLVLPELIRDLEVKGSYVALVPNRDTLIVTGSEDPAGLGVMLRLGEEGFRGSCAVSGVALRMRDGQWEAFEPDAHFPELVGFRALRHSSVGSAYEAQKRDLDAVQQQNAERVCVQSYMMMPSSIDNTSEASRSIWLEGTTTLLPRTEKVVLITRDYRISACADWERVRDVVGDLMTPVDGYPRRFRVDRFPTREQLAALGFARGFEYLAQEGEAVPAFWKKLRTLSASGK